MSWIRSLKQRMLAILGRKSMDQEMDEELAFHLEMETEKYLRQGLDPAEARRRAMIAFGGVERYRQQTRDERGARVLEDLVQDARYALRQIRKYPGFSGVAIVTLAMGIGATTTIFSVVNGILLSPLTFQEPDRLVQVWPGQAFSKSQFTQFRESVPFLSDLGAYTNRNFTFPGEGDVGPEELGGASVSHNHFHVLGVAPALGRGFRPEDELSGQGQVVVISHGLWQRRFGGDPGILGQDITIADEGSARRTVVGIMPPDYRPLNENWQIWAPFQIDPDNFPDFKGTASLRFFGRIGAGVTMDQADARFHQVAERLTADLDFVTDEDRALAGVVPLEEMMVGDVRFRLLVLLGSVGLVLLLACVNVANLLLVRGQGRERELGIRLAVGAGRGRVVRQLLTESLVLGFVGGCVGLLLAFWSLPALVRILPSGIPRADLISLDGRVLVFSLAVSVASALLFGLLPAVKATGRDLRSSLRDGASGRGQAGAGQRLRNGLVVAELALAVVVVVGASLLFKSFWTLQHVDPGFEPDHVLTLRLTLAGDRYPDGESRHMFFEEVGRQVGGMAGVTDVGWSGSLPMGGGSMGIRYHSDDSPVPQEELPTYANVQAVSPGFFSALRIPMPRGGYIKGELAGTEEGGFAVVNRALALSLWPDGDDPVGKTVWLPFGSEVPARIIGMAEDFAQASLDRETRPEIFVPWEFWTPAQMYMVVRSEGDPEELIPGVRSTIWSVDGDVPVKYERTMEEVVSRTMADSRLTTLLLMVFGGLALGLGAIGVYGVASFAVTQSTFEIGVRMALGAGRNGVLAQVMRRFLAVAGVGIALGLFAAFGTSRVLSSLLFRVSSTDPPTFLGVAALLTLVALGAVLVPAFRASRIEPARVLKEE